MPKGTALLDEAHELITRRLDELNEERKRLERALAALSGEARRRPGRPRGSKANATTANAAPKRRRGRGGGRADQAVGLI
jgi:hypothetical protein